ncbi:MAG: AAA family ATPase [Crocinitomicaceae bacterium]|nr:AAA family ATPase [Crocinitomicaceae bacterium]MDG1658278.1 AAA family ATPase [Crocinitomicaceae bacterium]|tara:strand:+ start:9198 stop:10631 length:1434 start_codon:yes stop_codon:yes gene_type:complete
MENSSFYSVLLENFGMEPTEEQSVLFSDLESFARDRKGKQLFLLKGYAGTGKTSVLGAFVKTLGHYKVKTMLMAPTGRAAKVFSSKSEKGTLTIHKLIYRRKSKTDFGSPISLMPNLQRKTLFIVDEASMIGDYSMQNDGNINSRNLLQDLFEYVYSSEGCKLILMGDDGQLPPVGSDHSPALNQDYLNNYYPELNIRSFKLNEVVRQAQDSEILRNATLLRNTNWVDYPRFDIQQQTDLIRLSGMDLQDELESSISKYGTEDAIVITRSNKNANKYNQQIRGRIMWFEEKLCGGDALMVVKNNYFWLGDESKVGFIANGEIIKVRRVLKVEELFGFEFAHLLVTFPDYEDLGDVELIIHTESLLVEAPNLPRDRIKALFYEIERDYIQITNKKKRYEAILNDPYFNALQVKYAYAVTCHKSQGGQWKHVYIDQGYISEEMMGPDYYRWLYTALTRGTEKVFLVNFSDEFFIGEPQD